MTDDQTREPQYQICLELRDRYGLTPLGLMSNQVWYDDPKRLTFLLARYKFVAKMFSGMNHVLEVGCADAFGTRVVLQDVHHLTAVDFDPVFVEDVQQRMDARWSFTCQVHDMMSGPVAGNFDGAYALDVLEHIPREEEHRFISNMVQSLHAQGTLIIGMPSLQSQEYASPPSKAGHVNCKDGNEFKAVMQQHFHNVFVFSMNDEVVHTGFYPMAHYLLALCCTRK
jgi:cyclopropane fatty-acyl-phospholipid synthase-like methyltransferase